MAGGHSALGSSSTSTSPPTSACRLCGIGWFGRLWVGLLP
jgi:hypothetical protein